MSKRTWKWRLVAALALVGAGVILGGLAMAATSQAPPPPPIPYLVTYLGDLGGGVANPNGINANGDCVGASKMPDNTIHAFLYTSATGMVDLNSLIDPTSGWVLAHARAVDDSRQVVGPGTHNGVACLYRFTPGTPGQVEDLSLPPGETVGDMHSINSFGQACGFTKSGGINHACYWSAPNAPVLIFPDGRSSEAFGINDKGQVVGHYWDAVKSTWFAFRWTPDGKWQSFGPFHNPRRGTASCNASAINDHGSFTGNATEVDSKGNSIGLRAFRYTDGIGMIDLYPAGLGCGKAINNNGDVVGFVNVPGTSSATNFLYTDAWGIRSIDALIPGGFAGGGLNGINDSGQICTYTKDGHAVLLTPIWP